MRTIPLSVAVLVALCAAEIAGPRPAKACSTPVYQYALERWEPDVYQITVFSRGPLSPEQAKLVQQIQDPVSSNAPAANVAVETVDLSATPPEEAKKITGSLPPGPDPVMVVRYPASSGIEQAVWSSPLTPAAVSQLLDSPVRRKIAQGIERGDIAVWVLLESGAADKDRAATATLSASLTALQKEMRDADAQGTNADDAVDASADWGGPPVLPKSYAFSVCRLTRDDPAEPAFRAMLLHSEPDLDSQKDPMAFAVFGRGRLLAGLVGKGISRDNISEIAWFANGPCACEVKAANPGTDLLMAADWDRALEAVPVTPQPAPDLTGVDVSDAATNAPMAEASTNPPAAATACVTAPSPAAATATADAPHRSGPMRVAAVSIAALLLVVGFAGVVAMRRTKR